MNVIVGWWDAIELWLVQLEFLPQVLVLLAVMLPLSLGIAQLTDCALGQIQRLLGQRGDR